MSKKAGWEWRVFIDGAAYGAAKYQLKPQVPELDVTDSESALNAAGTQVHAEVLYGVGKLVFRLESVSYDNTVNPFGAPKNLRQGTFHSFEVEPYDGGDRHSFGGLITSPTLDGDVNGLQPVTIEGTSNGVFVLAGEV